MSLQCQEGKEAFFLNRSLPQGFPQQHPAQGGGILLSSQVSGAHMAQSACPTQWWPFSADHKQGTRYMGSEEWSLRDWAGNGTRCCTLNLFFLCKSGEAAYSGTETVIWQGITWMHHWTEMFSISFANLHKGMACLFFDIRGWTAFACEKNVLLLHFLSRLPLLLLAELSSPSLQVFGSSSSLISINDPTYQTGIFYSGDKGTEIPQVMGLSRR